MEGTPTGTGMGPWGQPIWLQCATRCGLPQPCGYPGGRGAPTWHGWITVQPHPVTLRPPRATGHGSQGHHGHRWGHHGPPRGQRPPPMGTPTCTALLIMPRSGVSTSRCSCAQEAPRSARSTSGGPNLGTWGRGWGPGDTQGATCGAGRGGTWRGADRCPPRGTAAAARGGRLRAEGERGAAVAMGTPRGRDGDSGVAQRAWENSRQRLRQSQREGVRFPPITAQLAWLPPITARQTPASHQSWREEQGSYQSQQRGRKVPPIAAEHAPASDQSQPNTPPSHQSQQTGHGSHQSLGGGAAATNHSTAHLPPTNQSRGAGVSHQSQHSTPASHQ